MEGTYEDDEQTNEESRHSLRCQAGAYCDLHRQSLDQPPPLLRLLPSLPQGQQLHPDAPACDRCLIIYQSKRAGRRKDNNASMTLRHPHVGEPAPGDSRPEVARGKDGIGGYWLVPKNVYRLINQKRDI